MTATRQPGAAADFPRTRRAGGAAWLVGVSALLGLLTLVGTFLLVAGDLRSTGRKDASRDLTTSAHLLADHAGRLFEVADVALRDAARIVQGLNWDEIAGSPPLHAALRELSETLPYIEDVWLNDSAGTLRLTSFAFPTPASTAADREAFRRIAAGADAMQIGERIVGRVTGRPTFLLARRLSHADGSFRGMASVTGDLSYFDDYWTRARQPLDARVSLVRDRDFDILAQHPAPPSGAMTGSAALRAAIATARSEGQFTEGEGAEERLVAYHQVGTLPLYVTLSVSERAIAAAWRDRVVSYGLLGGIAALALSALSFVAFRQARIETRAMHGLVRARERLSGQNAQLEAEVAGRTAALRESEAALRQLNESLERRVREEVVAREAVQARLAHAQRMEALGQLAGGVAHDINNVLQVVIGTAEAVEDASPDDWQVAQLARSIAEAAERGAGITQRLLAFARRVELRAEVLDATALLKGLGGLLGRTLGNNVTVAVRADRALPLLLADRGQLETVLVNLAANARDAMPVGGTLILSAAAVQLGADGSAAPGPYVRLTVTDTGQGMPPEVLARATEPFFTTKEIGKGTGLGLSMAQGFAEQSGGTLAIESEPGRGTSVHLCLPAAPGASPPESAEVGAPQRRQHRARILLVDDDAAVRATTARQLEKKGFEVLAVASGLAAMALLATGEVVDAMVTDLAMPGMDGLALIRDARRLQEDLPVVLLTGFVTNAAELAVGGAVTGAYSLLRKPVTSDQIARRVQALLDGEAVSVEQD
ncbi:ATP-binding protein [Roseomonas sp. CCTCC AB2023176]|uniref:ATP-binding protein n=1 Tax=Roseomonas sp. CCTCC AB2023176 TaxID=3342640 RepID=UPI0035D78D59